MTQQLLCISTVWPQANATAAGVRITGLLDILAADYQIHFAATSRDETQKNELEKKGVSCHDIQLNDPSFEKLLLELSPKVVLFDRFIAEEQFGWLVREKLPNTLCVLDTEDLHSLRAARELALKKEFEFSIEFWKKQELTLRELASIYRSDLSLLVSSYEYELLIQEWKVPEQLLMFLPMTYEEVKINSAPHTGVFDQTQGYVFVGNGIHKPNKDAIKWLYSHIWPEILKLQPKASVQIFGAYLPQEILELDQQKKGFYVRGQALEISDVFMSARINLAPLRFGAGIKGKLLDGFRFGVPHVTTDIGAEGMQFGDTWPGLIAKHSKDFAKAAVSLYENEDLWNEKRQLGFSYINTYNNPQTHSKRLLSVLDKIKDQLNSHRAQSPEAYMLRSQAFMAAKYLSLWIREKNKND
ncbi:MAG: glycosyltransferase family 4 protein [Flavobacteriia bacterium]|nr:glycosyltransferase family 4 protein [Flavobacteriia bacterium]